MNNFNATTNTSVNLTAQLPSDATGNVVFKINGKTISSKISVVNGEVSYVYDIPLYSAKDYNITLVYSGNSIYDSVRINTTLTLTKLSTSVIINNITTNENEDTQITATVTNDQNNPANDMKVVFKVNGKTIGSTRTDSKGVATITYNFNSSYTNPYNNLTVVVGENSFYQECRNNSQLTIVMTPKITFSNITSKTNGTITFTATLPVNATGNAVFKINGVTVSPKISVSNGSVKYTYQLSQYRADSYKITFVYSGCSVYYSARINSILTVTKLNTTVTVTNVTSHQNVNTALIFKVVDENNNPVYNVSVVFKVNGKTIGSNTTTDKGFATLNYNFTKSYTEFVNNLTVKVGENAYYAGCNGSSIINLVKATNVTIKSVSTETGKVVVFNATVTDLNKNPVNTGNVSFYINGTYVGSISVKNGVATLNQRISLYDAGTYTITAVYNQTDSYLKGTGTNTITLSKISTNTNSTDFEVSIGDKGNTTITVTDSYGKNVSKGNVTIYVNNTNMGTYNLTNGSLVYNYTPAYSDINKNFTFKVVYNSNGVYTSSTYTSTIRIVGLQTAYVSTNGSNSNDGSKTSPFKTIQYAVDHIKSNGTIYINPGTYYEKKINLSISVNITGLSSDPSSVVINGNNTEGYIFNITSSDATVYINNITFKNVLIKTNASAAIISDGVLAIHNTIFENSVSNATSSATAIYAKGYLEIDNSTIRNNHIYKTNSSSIVNTADRVVLYEVMFYNNVANGSDVYGPAAYLINSNTTLFGCQFINNTAIGYRATSGALSISSGNVSINGNIFRNNSVKGGGATVGGAIVTLYATVNILNTNVTSNSVTSTNSSAFGGAMYSEGSTIVITNATFKNNSVKGKNAYGGVMYGYYSYYVVSNSTFDSNKLNGTADAYGGVIASFGGTFYSNYTSYTNNVIKANNTYGGAIYFSGSTFNITHVAFTSNIANGTNASGGGAISISGNATMTYCNFTSNQALSSKANVGGAIINAGNLSVTYSNFISNQASLVGSAISNSGTIVTILDNYWGSSSPTWSKLLYNATKPSSYKTSKI
ncbi:MAG: Ig-like domain repeat protein [Methanosphaera sp.]|nr:Ig-like domain repeat protein [Methanosphaera sp.]